MSILEIIKRDHPSWIIVGPKSDGSIAIKISLLFPEFKSAFSFMTMVALKSEEINHHPTWTNVYNKLSILLTTHDKGNQLGEADLVLVKWIENCIALFKVLITHE